MSEAPPLLEVVGACKRFGGVAALAGVDLRVQAGSVHGLLGENGAGKSTLIKGLAGTTPFDAGAVRIGGVPTPLASVAAAGAAGLRFIHQELSLVPQFSAVENAFVGRRYPTRWGLIDRGAMRRRLAGAARTLAPDLPLDRPAARLTVGQRQLVEILRALAGPPARLIVMDEPTAALSEGEARRLHRAVRALASTGVAILFISHRLDEVMALCDHYTVLRNGRVAGHGVIAQTTPGALVRLMSGAARAPVPPAAPVAPAREAAPVLEVRGLAFGPAGGRLDLDVAAGEIVGLYGLVGAGRSSLLKLIWGAHPARAGRIAFEGIDLAPRGIGARIAADCAYVPEDRRHEGLVTTRSVADNLALADWPAVRRWPGLPIPSRRRLAARARAVAGRLALKMASPWAPPLSLSGGNQQKLLFGRWSGRKIRLFLLDEPTRGVDVGAKAEIHAHVRALAATGAAVLFATGDLDELLGLADRVLVLAGGVVAVALAGPDLTAERVVAAAFALRPGGEAGA